MLRGTKGHGVVYEETQFVYYSSSLSNADAQGIQSW